MEKRKKVVGDPSKCSSCITCQLVCSFRRYGVFNPAKSAIQIIYGDDCLPREIVFKDCEVCGECVINCPRGALAIVEV